MARVSDISETIREGNSSSRKRHTNSLIFASGICLLLSASRSLHSAVSSAVRAPSKLVDPVQTPLGKSLRNVDKEIRELPNIIQKGEIIVYATFGALDSVGTMLLFGASDRTGSTVLAVLTDQRIVFVDKGMVWGLKVADIPLDSIQSITYTKGLIVGSLVIYHGSRAFRLNSIGKEAGSVFAARAKSEMDARKNADQTPVSGGAATQTRVEQVKGLKELHDLGIITAEEFDRKKNELLGL